ncbi:fluoride efflux transporter CrcB [Xylophilus sp.]|uniref:fluoride efflux transporter CrcB n=1 Tax=Xylophilus sp. TaxID=2653893 RepID=UPI0013B9EB76|nr:fluoride efflux transporter CrcB [Xylophilus sp.]KAF1046287.1 MAG: putative fluoride ion transporter CrcB [Xylophilus sp.]
MGAQGFLIVFLGGGFGSALRHGANLLAARWTGAGWPFGTLAINVLGSLLMGVVAEAFALRSGWSPQLRLLLVTGILGGFTTFSTFSLETALLHERGDTGQALLYVAASVLLGVGGLFAGMRLVRLVLG